MNAFRGEIDHEQKQRILPFSDVQTGLLPPPTPVKKRVKISPEMPMVCIYDKNKSVMDIHKKNPSLSFPPMVPLPPKKKRSRIRSPVVDRHPILIDPPEINQSSVCKQRKRQQRLTVMNICKKRRERKERLQRFNQISELKLQMKFGELSDDFYLYCRRWKENQDEDFKRIVDEISRLSKPIRHYVWLNFRFFTKIMLQQHKAALQFVHYVVC